MPSTFTFYTIDTLMKNLLFLSTILIGCLNAQPTLAYFNDLDGLLNDHIKTVTKKGITYNGVDYDAWAQDPRHEKVRNEILSTNPSTLGSKNEKLAYWINTYNVLTIDLINSQNERDSIKNLGSIFASAWKSHKWTFADGRDLHLDNIEHDIIRKMNEARIHFAVNCAAKSCPDLRSESYRPNKLDAQLDEQTHLTFKNSTKGYTKLDGENAVRVTKVMDWFDKDFNGGNLNSWLSPYFPNIIDDNTKVKFFSYDWSLNKQ